jgi:hypothetical protein
MFCPDVDKRPPLTFRVICLPPNIFLCTRFSRWQVLYPVQVLLRFVTNMVALSFVFPDTAQVGAGAEASVL